MKTKTVMVEVRTMLTNDELAEAVHKALNEDAQILVSQKPQVMANQVAK